MVGWGTRTEDRCWYRDDVLQFEEDEKKKKEETAGKAPNPAWGTEKMRSKSVQEEVSKTGLKDPEAKAQVDVVKASDEEESKEKEKPEAAGSSKDPP